MLKSEIRPLVLKRRCEIAYKEKYIADNSIQDFILNSEEFLSAEKVFVYVSTEFEVSTTKIIDTALKMNKTLAVPSCDYQLNQMSFVKIKSTSELTLLKHGIYEPEFSEEKVEIPTDKTLCIVPALAFDKFGYRVGYGMGFYDKYLSEYDIMSIGVCYSEFIYDKIKSESHDIAVKKIATENGFLKLNNRN